MIDPVTMKNYSNATTKIGKWWNDIIGVTTTQEYNAKEAEKQRDWEKMMSDTAVQRAAEDYAAAGFNSANAIGRSASTPSGAAASSTNPNSNIVDGLNKLVNSVKAISEIASASPKAIKVAKGLAMTSNSAKNYGMNKAQIRYVLR